MCGLGAKIILVLVCYIFDFFSLFFGLVDFMALGLLFALLEWRELISLGCGGVSCARKEKAG